MPGLAQIIYNRAPWLNPKGFVSSLNSNPDKDLTTQKTGPLVLAMDCLLFENLTLTSEPTKSEVEDGEVISDHVTLKPMKLSIEAIITNTPLPESLAFIETNYKLLPSPAVAAHAILTKLYQERIPFDFVGGFQVYKGMVLTTYNPQRQVKTGSILQFAATLEQIKTVTTQTVQAAKMNSAAKKNTAPKQDMGTQPAASGTAKGVEPTAQTVGDMKYLNMAPSSIPIPGL